MDAPVPSEIQHLGKEELGNCFFKADLSLASLQVHSLFSWRERGYFHSEEEERDTIFFSSLFLHPPSLFHLSSFPFL